MKIIAFIALWAAVLPAGAEPVLLHVHGMGFSTDGRSLLVSSHTGLAAYRDGSWSRTLESELDFSGFAVAARSLYASGHPAPDVRLRNPLGLAASTDGGHTWQSLALEGEADFHLIAASYEATSIYVVNHVRNSAMPSPGLYFTRDEGKIWTRAAAHRVEGEILALAVHPRQAQVLAVATDRGLYLSFDGGERFRRVDRRQAVTAVIFDSDGERVRYALALSNSIAAYVLDRGRRETIRLPPLGRDYITHLAQHPNDPGTFAVATRRRDVFLSKDGGLTWHRIAREGELP